MSSSLMLVERPGRNGGLRTPHPSALAAILLGSLLLLPATTTSANQTTYGFFSAFVAGSLVDSLSAPRNEFEPDNIYKPDMHGTMVISTQMVDLFPADPLHGYYVDYSRSNQLSFEMEGQQFSLLGNLSFETFVNGASYLSVYDEFFRINFLFYNANFTTDSVSNLLNLPTGFTRNDIDLWTLNAMGGGFAYSDKAASVWHLNEAVSAAGGSDSATSLAVPAATVPEHLPVLAGLVPLLLAGLVHRRTRCGPRATSLSCPR